MAAFETASTPPTYDEAFHGDKNLHLWISKMPYRTLGKTDLQLSTLSYGGSSLGGFYGEVEKQEAVETIQQCIKSGINYLDTSPWYGESESVIGEALVEIPRQTYYLGTKVGRNFTPGWEGRFDFSGSAVLKNVEQSLERLRLPYVDIIQIHDFEFCQDTDMLTKETLPALESVVKAGKAKFIGITGYDLNFLKAMTLKAGPGVFDTILSYARFNLHDDSLLEFSDFFADNNVGIINAAPLAMGLLTTVGPPTWHAATEPTKLAARHAAKLASRQGSTLEKSSLQFSLHPPQPITTTLVSIPTKTILEENLKIVTSPIDAKDQELQELILAEFKTGNAGNWEGVEIEQYRNFLANRN